MSPPRLRIYLAGPEVFLPDARAVGAAKARLCAAAGFEGCFPLDNQIDLDRLDKATQAQRISLANEGLMRSCDLLIANLTPFRGASMDSGTAFEVGFMRALGRPVLGYTNVTPDYQERARAWQAVGKGLPDCDAPGIEVEDFGLAENLMIEIAIRESGGTVHRACVVGPHVMADLKGFKLCLDDALRLCSN
jgi:nucleoside 2-deoxyribosyltransferase